MGTYDAVFKQTDTYSVNQGQVFFSEAKESLKSKEYDAAYSKLIESIEAYRAILSVKPHDRTSREGILESWNLVAQLYPTSHNIIFPEAIEENDTSPLQDPNAFIMLKTAIIDTLLESDWKKQCNGKYGGPKPHTQSWKSYYFNNETTLEALDDDFDKVTWATQHGHHQLLKILLHKHKKMNVSTVLNDNGETLLEIAIKNEDILCAAVLIDHGAKIDNKGTGKWSPLHWAVHKGNVPIVNLLLENKAKVNVKGANGLTPLHVAAFEGYLEIANLLLEHKSKINIFDKKNNLSPLHLAAYQGHIAILELLLEKKANFSHVDSHKRTLLHWAATYGKTDIAEVLLAFGADANAKDDLDRTPLHWAAQTGHLDIVSVLVEKGIKLKDTDRFGEKALVIAAFAGHTKCMAYLFDHSRST